MNNIFTWIGGYEFCKLKEISVFLNSLQSVCSADVYVFTHEMTDELRQQLNDRNIKVIDIDGLVVSVVRDRFYYYWKYIKENNLTGQLLHVDSKDVLFLRNPFDRRDELCLISENMTHEESIWNMVDQSKHQRQLNSFHSDWRKWEVLNAGVMLGSVDKMAEMFFLIWSNLLTVKGNCGTDQAVLNYLYHQHLHVDEEIKVLRAYCLTGEAIVQGFVKNVNLNNYVLFHQWDRTSYREEILTKWA